MQGGSGYAKDITFEDITLDSVNNPIIIDQYYCENSHSCRNQVTELIIEGSDSTIVHIMPSNNYE